MADRRGRQTPTQSVVLPYTETLGQEAVARYNDTGRTAQEWQELLLCDLLAVNEDGLWTHTKFGYSVPRRNGKNEIVAMRELYGLERGEHILHTAHRTTTSSSASRRLAALLDGAPRSSWSKRASPMTCTTPTRSFWALKRSPFLALAAAAATSAPAPPREAWARALTCLWWTRHRSTGTTRRAP